jgi:hypothetical protein
MIKLAAPERHEEHIFPANVASYLQIWHGLQDEHGPNVAEFT